MSQVVKERCNINADINHEISKFNLIDEFFSNFDGDDLDKLTYDYIKLLPDGVRCQMILLKSKYGYI